MSPFLRHHFPPLKSSLVDRPAWGSWNEKAYPEPEPALVFRESALACPASLAPLERRTRTSFPSPHNAIRPIQSLHILEHGFPGITPPDSLAHSGEMRGGLGEYGAWYTTLAGNVMYNRNEVKRDSSEPETGTRRRTWVLVKVERSDDVQKKSCSESRGSKRRTQGRNKWNKRPIYVWCVDKNDTKSVEETSG